MMQAVQTRGRDWLTCVLITAVPITKLFAWGGGGGTMEDMCYERLRAEACVLVCACVYCCSTYACVYFLYHVLRTERKGCNGAVPAFSFTTQPEAKGRGVKCTETAFAAALSRFVWRERERAREGEECLCRGVRC